MLPVPDASLPAVEICSDSSAAGMIASASCHAVVGQEDDAQMLARADRAFTTSATE